MPWLSSSTAPSSSTRVRHARERDYRGGFLLRIGEGRPGPMLERNAARASARCRRGGRTERSYAGHEHLMEAPAGGGDAGYDGGARVKRAPLACDRRRGREEHVQIARRQKEGCTLAFQGRHAASGEAQMNKAVEERQEAQVVFEYSRDPMFRSTHADGFVGGLTPNGQVHIAFSPSARCCRSGIRLQAQSRRFIGRGSAERQGRQRTDRSRDMQVDVLMTVQAAEGLEELAGPVHPEPEGAREQRGRAGRRQAPP